jgi:hypothetical protein
VRMKEWKGERRGWHIRVPTRENPSEMPMRTHNKKSCCIPLVDQPDMRKEMKGDGSKGRTNGNCNCNSEAVDGEKVKLIQPHL